MNKYIVDFQFTKAWFSQHRFTETIESELDLKQFVDALQKQLVDNNEFYRVVKVTKIPQPIYL